MPTCSANLTAPYHDNGNGARSTLMLLRGWSGGGVARGDDPPGTTKELLSKFTGPFATIPAACVGHSFRGEVPAAAAHVLVQHFSCDDPADLGPQAKDD